MEAEKVTEFKGKLAALLKEYNVSISFDVSDASDTHGIFGEKICLYEGDYGWGDPFHTVSGWGMEWSDL
jgi:hypothetical protein